MMSWGEKRVPLAYSGSSAAQGRRTRHEREHGMGSQKD